LAAQPLLCVAQTAPAVTRESLAGMYDGHQMEVGAQLLLKPDGHFEYELAYGAMDEEGKGTWELRDGAVFLTSVPAVVPPRFVVVSDTPEPKGGLFIKMVRPLSTDSRQRVYLIYGPGEEPDMAEVQDSGFVLVPAGKKPTAFVMEIPVFPIETKPIPLTGTGGHRFVLKFEPNDIGKADFKMTRLAIEDGVLVMPRRDLGLMLKFKRQQ
jgi:hypothetical protein